MSDETFAPTEATSDTERFILRVGAPTLGCILSALLAAGPMPAVRAARLEGKLGSINSDLFCVYAINAVALMLYGAMTENKFLFAGNIISTVLSLFYLMSAIGIAESRVRTRMEVITLTSATALVATVFVPWAFAPSHAADALGLFANASIIVLFAAPLSTVMKVVKDRNSASINRPFGIMTVVNCIVWSAYSLYIGDIYIGIPNILGLILGVIQCSLMVIFPSKKPTAEAESAESENPKSPIAAPEAAID